MKHILRALKEYYFCDRYQIAYKSLHKARESC